MNAIKIWDVAYKGQESVDCLQNRLPSPSRPIKKKTGQL